jgi:probable F420-dependent oxidoreductase
MRVDGRIDVKDLGLVPALVRELERSGFDGAFAGEAGYDPFLQLAIAVEHSDRLELGSGVAIALARNPMQTAQTAHDLHAYSGGRFILGLGSQVRAHIERRFGASWSRPTDRMREFVLAVRAIWRAWNSGEPLHFEGEFYRHTMTTEIFSPGPNPFGSPRIFLAAVGPRMAEVAGEVADGLLMHSFVTEAYVRGVIVPAVARGLATSGREGSSFELSCYALTVTSAESEARTREHVAFYGSTPAYRRVLDSVGRGDLQAELNALLRAGRPGEMQALVDDDVLDAFAFRATPEGIPAKILERYGDIVDRVVFRGPYEEHHAAWAEALH